MSDKVIGILGGMGPEATVDFMTKIIRNTPAKIDQEHLRIFVDNNPKIPDRTKAILDNGENPGPVMAEMARNLEKMGADLLAIPCNTAHYYIQEVIDAVQIPVLNMIEETVQTLIADNVDSIALLATTGTLKTQLYEKKLLEAGIKLILPSPEYQEKVMKTIFAVKSGDIVGARTFNQDIINHVVEKGAKAIILGCTELPIAFAEEKSSLIPFYDPTQILAQAIVKTARGEVYKG